ncbi:neuromedin-U receptor 2 isoform X2 [Malaya genurostris]|uniref:neuromedin-U receptor 2 isoform X2 n=1 Tax=Malaya genurostris TaxID=325434 RepID=UPI0026F3999F|nr:neuromedin-U receptor 2 isoform X2 [Malaya genurostris]
MNRSASITDVNTSIITAIHTVIVDLTSVIMNSTSTADIASTDGSMLFDATRFTYDNIDENLTEIYGPKRDPLYVVLPVTIIYVLIFLTGVIGNISTCIVISKNKSMHTATNYYLYSLAVSDFLLLISGVPQEIYFIWSKYPYIFGEVFCIVRGIAAETSANATVLTITAFTVERYVAICHPFLSHTMSKLSRAVRFVFAIWIVAIISAIPQALQFGVTNQSGVDQCVVKRIIIHHSFELSTFVFFFAPMTLITVLYALIGLKLRSSALIQRDGTLQRRNNACPNNRQQGTTSQGTRRVLKMLVAVVVAFFVCWAPFHAQRLVYIYGVDKDHQPTDPLILKFFVATTYISGILYYLSTCINPLLYNIMSNKFRQAFKETLAHGCYFTRKSHCKERSYRTLCRRERHPPANEGSFEFSGSVQDDSLYSSSTRKQSVDTITLSREFSSKNYCRGRQIEQGTAGSLTHPTKGVILSAHLDLYKDEKDVYLSVFSTNDSSTQFSVPLVNLNRSSFDEMQEIAYRGTDPSPPQNPVVRISVEDNPNHLYNSVNFGVTKLEVIYSNPVELSISCTNEHKGSHRDFRKYFQIVSWMKNKRHQHHRGTVHFYSPVACGPHQTTNSERNSGISIEEDKCHFKMQEDKQREYDLETYMEEIKLRENLVKVPKITTRLGLKPIT